MKTIIISGIAAGAILLAGCSKRNDTAGGPAPSTKQSANAAPVARPAMTAWQQGDTAAAVTSFLDTDWSARPLFPSDSTLSLSEAKFASLPAAERQAKEKEMLAQVDSLKRLGAAVAQAGREAAAKGDAAQARKCFTSVKQCGTALDSPDRLLIVQLVGRALNKMADAELAKIGK